MQHKKCSKLGNRTSQAILHQALLLMWTECKLTTLCWWIKRIMKSTHRWSHLSKRACESVLKNLVKCIITLVFCRRPTNNGSNLLICPSLLKMSFTCHFWFQSAPFNQGKNICRRNLLRMQWPRTVSKPQKSMQLLGFWMDSLTSSQSQTRWLSSNWSKYNFLPTTILSITVAWMKFLL